MKTNKLLLYAVAGIITGLLLENTGLRLRNTARRKARDLKRSAKEKLSKA